MSKTYVKTSSDYGVSAVKDNEALIWMHQLLVTRCEQSQAFEKQVMRSGCHGTNEVSESRSYIRVTDPSTPVPSTQQVLNTYESKGKLITDC